MTSRVWLLAPLAVAACNGIFGVSDLGYDGNDGGGPASSSAAHSATSGHGGGVSSSSTAGGTTGSVGGGDTGGGGSAPNCEESPCKLRPPQCGCANDEKCVLDDNGAGPVCAGVGSAAVGEACSQGDCGLGMDCGDSWDAQSMCFKFCTDNSDCPDGDGAICVWNYQGSNTWCSHDCDPLDGSGCLPGDTCALVWDTDTRNNVGTTCAGTGPKEEGQPCGMLMRCEAGLICSQFQCRVPCIIGTDDCGAQSCQPFSEPALIGAVEYGSCK